MGEGRGQAARTCTSEPPESAEMPGSAAVAWAAAAAPRMTGLLPASSSQEHREAQVNSCSCVAAALPGEHEVPTVPVQKRAGLLPVSSSHQLHGACNTGCTSSTAASVVAAATQSRSSLPSELESMQSVLWVPGLLTAPQAFLGLQYIDCTS